MFLNLKYFLSFRVTLKPLWVHFLKTYLKRLDKASSKHYYEAHSRVEVRVEMGIEKVLPMP